jgi:hypothetical protein
VLLQAKDGAGWPRASASARKRFEWRRAKNRNRRAGRCNSIDQHAEAFPPGSLGETLVERDQRHRGWTFLYSYECAAS